MTEQKDSPVLEKPPAKPVRFQAVADLIREAYGAKRKRLTVSKADLEAMYSGPKLEAAQREELLRLAASDRMLDRTRELLLLNAERLASQPLAGQVRSFVGDMLRLHPAFRELGGVIGNLPEAMSDEAALELLASQSFAGLPWQKDAPPLKKSEAEQGRLNAVYCLLLWMRETRGTSVERIQRHLHATAWAPAAQRQKTDAQVLRTLMQARDRAALGIARATLESKVREQSQEAVAARDAEERAAARAKELGVQLEKVSTQLEAEKDLARSLAEGIEKARREHDDAIAHMRNEYEELRGRLLRRLRQEVSLLDEGLQALRREPPKVHVMDDHAERAIHALKGEIERIKGGSE